MAQIGFDVIGDTWVDASTLGTMSSGKSYYIQNRGSGFLLAVESASEPTDEAGMEVQPYKVIKYTVETDKLWLKATMGVCNVNICEA